jgi:hypothetical protein
VSGATPVQYLDDWESDVEENILVKKNSVLYLFGYGGEIGYSERALMPHITPYKC